VTGAAQRLNRVGVKLDPRFLEWRADMNRHCLAACWVAAFLYIHAEAAQPEHQHGAMPAAEVNFPVSCTPEARANFNTAAALLYSFHWERIDAAVAEVLAADPTCSMAHWLKAVASLDNALGSPPTPKQEQRGWASVQTAKQLGGKTQRERDYIAAVEVVYKDYEAVPFTKRALAYEQALERIFVRYPEDTEAAVLYAFWLQVTADRNDQTYGQQLKSARILEKIFVTQPNHPGVAHFIIHAYDFPPIAEHGLQAARRYASIAPDAPHALHMPSHIFSRVGAWRDSIDTNRRSMAVSTLDRDVYHAMDYMMYASLQLADDGEAGKWVKAVTTALKPNEETRQIAYAGAAIPARYALERGDWLMASQLTLHPTREQFNWSPFPEGESVNVYARGLGAARRGDAAAARTELVRLGELRAALVTQKKDYWIQQSDIQASAISAWIACAEGRNDDALKLMRETADREDQTEEHIMMPGRVIPVREMLGELLLKLNQPGLALKEFERSLQDDPNRFRNLYGAGRAAELVGNREKANAFYSRLLAQVAAQPARRAEIDHAREFIARR
jgi:tetratricopeptide (TPR) repeat protein